jgi:hypothetical protein
MLPVAGLTVQATLVPEGKFPTENCRVFSGDMVAIAGLTLVGAGAAEASRLIAAVALLVVSAALVAVIVMLCARLAVAGAVYKPLTTRPILGLSDQVTAVSEVPLTEAVNWVEWPPARERTFGVSETLTGAVVASGVMAGPSVMVALAVLVGSAALVAKMVTSESAVTELGAE